MKFLLVYKGQYGENLAGPEMRNVGIARALLARAHQVTLVGRPEWPHTLPDDCDYVCLRHPLALLRAFWAADAIVLHGGGPLLLALALLAGLTGKQLVSDAYVPHWIELEQSARPERFRHRLRLHGKACFNVWRALLMSLTFNLVIVANRRQLDLCRGMGAPFFLVESFCRTVVIPFGCDPVSVENVNDPRSSLIALSDGKLTNDQFLVGWLGGVYEWFGLDDILTELASVCDDSPQARFVFFGVEDKTRLRLLSILPEHIHHHFVFLPWVPFKERLNYWQGLDLSLVWGQQGYENDYASRTRNVDCVTLGLPIVQNRDDDWGPRLEKSGAGVVVENGSLAFELSRLASNEDDLSRMREAIRGMAPALSWECFADTLIGHMSVSPMSCLRRMAGLLLFALALPALLFGAFAGVIIKWRKPE